MSKYVHQNDLKLVEHTQQKFLNIKKPNLPLNILSQQRTIFGKLHQNQTGDKTKNSLHKLKK